MSSKNGNRAMRAWIRSGTDRVKEGTGTTFSVAGTLVSGNRRAPGEKARDERMADGLRELTAVWGRKSCD